VTTVIVHSLLKGVQVYTSIVYMNDKIVVIGRQPTFYKSLSNLTQELSYV
jgi:hypothetical protein